jgi:hypothetical protein
MSNFSISNNREWYDIVQDGNGGVSNRIQGSITPFVSVNTTLDSNNRTIFSIFYYDSVSGFIRRSFDRSPDMEFQNLSNVNGLTGVSNLVGYTEQTNAANHHYYYTDNTYLYSSLNNLPLTTFSNNVTNVKIKKYISSTNAFFVLSIDKYLYTISGDNAITYTQLVIDYDGRDFYPYINDATQTTYVAYTTENGIKVITPDGGGGGGGGGGTVVTTYGTIVYTSAKKGNSAIFNNTVETVATNYILIGYTQTNPISISLWFNTTDLTNAQKNVFALTDSSLNSKLTVYINSINYSSGMVLTINGSGGNVDVISTSSVVVPNTWYHLCITIDSSYNSILYVNGSNVGSVVSSPLANVSGIFLGGIGIAALSFLGYIDELNVYNRAISNSEVTTLYNLGNVTANLTAHYALDTPISTIYAPTVTTGNVLVTSSVKNNSGIFNNSYGVSANNFITVNNNTNLPISTAFWFYPLDTANLQTIVSLGNITNNSNNSIEFNIEANSLIMNVEGANVISNITIIPNSWYSIFASVANSNISLYVNANLDVGTFSSNTLNYTEQFVIGCNNNGLGNGFSGFFDEFYVFNNFNANNVITFNSNVVISDTTGQKIYIPFDTPLVVTNTSGLNYNVVGNVGVNLSSAIVGNSAFFINAPGEYVAPNNYITVSNNQNVPISISFWFNSNDNDNPQSILSLTNATLDGEGLEFACGGTPNNNFIIAAAIPTAWTTIGNVLININTWYHVVFTMDASFNYKLYFNNSLIDSGTGTGAINSYTTFKLGGSCQNIRGYNGYIDEFLVYNRIVSATEVSSLYNIRGSTSGNSLSVVSNGAIIYMPLDGNTKTNEFCVACGHATNVNSSSMIYSYDGINWKKGTDIFENYGNGIAYNGSMWVAVGFGTDNTIAYSLDGINWIGLGVILPGLCVAWNGSMWLAGGVYPISLIYSYDGINWTKVISEIFINSVVESIGTNGSMWIIGGYSHINSAIMAYSNDGLNWTSININGIFGNHVYEIVYNGTIWVAGGIGPTSIAFSNDGITWYPTANNLLTTVCIAIAWNGSLWVAVGDGTNFIIYSNDGVTWTASSETLTDQGIPREITWNGSMWIIITDIGYIKYSINGNIWYNSNIGVPLFTYGVDIVSSYVLPITNNVIKPNTLNITNGVMFGSVPNSGVTGGATLFSNVNVGDLPPTNYIKLNNTHNGPFTVSLWFYTNTNVHSTILSFSDSSLLNVGINVDFTSTSLLLIASFTSITTGAYTMLPNTWYHLAFTISNNVNSNILKGYLNGIQFGQNTGTNLLINYSTIVLGGIFNTNKVFNGYMSEFMFYNSVLTDSQIFDLYKLKTNLNGRIIYLPLNVPLSNTPTIPVTTATTIGTISYTTAVNRNSGFFNNAISTVNTPPTNYMFVPYTQSVPITISFWFNFSNTSTGILGSILGLTNNSNDYIINFNVTGSTLSVNMNGFGGLSTSTYTISQNRWYHVCLTINSSNFQKFFVNNALIGSGTGSGSMSGNTRFIIGGSCELNKPLFGYIDEFAVYNRVLTTMDLTNLYNLRSVTNGRITYLPFDAPSNTSNTSNTVAPTIVGTVNYTTSVKGNSRYFNNTTGIPPLNYLTIPYTNPFPISISFWINCKDVTQYQSPIGLTDNSYNYILNFDILLSTIMVTFVNGGFVGTSTPIISNSWYHICATIDATNNQSFYVNGNLIGGGTATLPNPSYTKFILGGSSDFERGYNGYIDDFIIYNRILSSGEIGNIANTKTIISNDSVLVYAPLDKFASNANVIINTYNPNTPLEINGLFNWLDISDISTLYQDSAGTVPVQNYGDNVSFIADKTGNANVSTTGTAPTYNPKLLNLKPGIDFLGGNVLISNSVTKSANVTLLWVGTVTNSINNNGQLWGHYGDTGTADTDICLRQSDTNGNMNWHTNNDYTINLQIDFNHPVIYLATMQDGTSMNFTMITNAGVYTNVNEPEELSWTSGSAPIYIGGSEYSSSNSYMSEILYYQRVLNQTEINTILFYLSTKWGINTAVPTAPIENIVSNWSPINQNRLDVWLDMSDYSKININSNTIVSNVVDKIAGLSYTPQGTYISNLTLSTGNINTLASLNFNNNTNANVYITGTYNFNSSGSLLFVANLRSTTNTNEAIISWGGKLSIGFENNNNKISIYGYDSSWSTNNGFNSQGTGYVNQFSSIRGIILLILMNGPTPVDNSIITGPFITGSSTVLSGSYVSSPNPYTQAYQVEIADDLTNGGIGIQGEVYTYYFKAPGVSYISANTSITFNTPAIVYSDWSNGNVSISVNGANLITGNINPPAGSQSTLTIGKDSYYYPMNLGEVLIYSEIISTETRQKVEGYLANKWSLNNSLPNDHPYANVSPKVTNIIYSLYNNPTTFNGLLLWLDGSDPYGSGVVPSEGDYINKWFDKSGNNNHFIQTVATRMPIYGLDKGYNKYGLLFNGGQYYTQEGSSFLVGLNKYTIFTAHRFYSGGLGHLITYVNSINYFWLRYYGSYFGVAAGSLAFTEVQYTTSYQNASGISCLKSDSIGTGYLNGTKVANKYRGLETEPTGTFVIGNNIVEYSNGGLNGSIFEILIFNYVMNDTEKEVVETYLANKWDMGSKLPNNHQYYMVNNSNLTKTGNVIYSGGYSGNSGGGYVGNSIVINNTDGSFSSNYLKIANTQNIPLSINFWMNCNDASIYQTVLGLSDTSFNTSGLNIDIIGGKLVANICLANVSYPNISTSISANIWHNVGLNIDNNYNGTLYLDGVNVGSASGGRANILNYTQFILGGPSDNSSKSYNGYIQNFNVYNRVLNYLEMKNIYNLGSNSVTDGLIIQQPLSGNVNISNITTNGNIIISGINTVSEGSIFFNNSTTGTSTQYLTIADSTNVPISISLWFNILDYDSGSGTILLINNGFALKLYQSKLQILCAIPNPWTMIELPITQINTWHHLCLTIDTAYKFNVYLDGIISGSATGTGNLPNSTSIFLGGDGANPGFNGFIEKLFIYNRALQSGEVNSLYNLNNITYGLTVNLSLTADPTSITNTTANITSYGTVTYSPGIIHNCAFFDNTVPSYPLNYLTVPNSQNLPLSFSFWMNCNNTASSGSQNPLSMGGTGGSGFGSIRCDVSSDQFRAYICTEDGSYIAYNFLKSYGWFHICVTIDSTYTGILYVNGAYIGSIKASRTSILNNSQINIASGPDSSGTLFAYKGYMEEVRIYNRVLSGIEVLSLYQSNNINAGLITHLPLDLPPVIISKTGQVPINSPFPKQYRGVWSGAALYGLNDVVLWNNIYWCLINTAGWSIGGSPPGYGWDANTNMSGSTIFNNPPSSPPLNTILTSYNISGAISFAFWVYYFDDNIWQVPVGLTNDSNSQIIDIFICYTPGIIQFESLYTVWESNPTGSISSNTWTHVCMTIDTAYLTKCYVNGVLCVTGDSSDLGAHPYTKFRLGGNCENTRGFQGYLQNFVVYNRALESYEVSYLYSMYTPTTGLLINLPLNQSSYGVINTSNETIFGNPTYSAGQIGNGVNFTDGTSYITVPNSTNVPMTICFWFNDTGYASGGPEKCIVSGDIYDEGFLVIVDGTGFYLYIAMPFHWNIIFHGIPYTTGAWNHAAITIDSSYNVILYINGANVGVNIGSGTGNSNIINLTKFSFGSANTYQSYGSLDDFQVYNRALRSFEVTSIYQTGLGGKSMTLNGLVTYLPFENGNEVQKTVGTVLYSGVNGGSAFFNNSDGVSTNYYTITNTTNLPLSVAFWFNPITGASSTVMMTANNNTGGINVSIHPDNILSVGVAIPTAWTYVNTTTQFNYNTWNHFCITIDSSYNIIVYLNGVSSSTGTGSAPITNFDLIYLGYNFKGYIENFMLYNRALSSGEVTSLYNVQNITSGRVIYLHLDSGNFDNSGGNNNNNQSNKYWLAGGYNSDASNCIAKSSDGLTWSYSTNNPFTGGLCSYVKWNESYWLSLGTNSNNTVCIAKSNDGLVWDESTNNPFTGGAGNAADWNGTYWIAVGVNTDNSVCIAKSTDGLSWTNSTNNPFYGGVGRGVRWNGTYWLSTGYNANANVSMAISSDGLNWTASSTNPFNGGSGFGIQWNGSYWIGVGENTDASICISASTDGNTWVDSLDNPFVGGVGRNIDWNGSYWVAVGVGGDDNTIAKSTDGNTWANATTNSFYGGQSTGVKWNGSKWVAVGLGSNTIVNSTDGLSWTPSSNDPFTGGSGLSIDYNTNTNANVTLLASLNSVIHSKPRIIMYNGTLYLFVVNSDNNYIYSTIIDNSKIATIDNIIKDAKDYKASIINGKLVLTAVNNSGRLNRITIANNALQYNNFIRTNINVSTFDITNLNDEEFIFYIGTDNFLHQVWNPSLFIDISSNVSISNINITNTDDSRSIYPEFRSNIFDYCVTSTKVNNLCNVNIEINSTTLTYKMYPSQSLHIYDSLYHYYIKLLPSNVTIASNITINDGYIPGYYVTSDTYYGNNSQYFYVLNSSGIPVWYRRNTSDPNYTDNPKPISLFLGMGKNRLITNIETSNIARTVIDVSTLIEQNFRPISPDSRGNIVLHWDQHESYEVSNPLARRGNIMFFYHTTAGGFYIQEQNRNRQIVWEFWSYDLITNQTGDYFHFDSLDVHPINGSILCSFRNCSTIACINYSTKNIDWAIDPTGDFTTAVITPNLINFLTPTNEPLYNGNQYDGTSGQHDCRWHYNIAPLTTNNDIISVYDDQTTTAYTARGVIYEIDLTNSNAIQRASVFSPNNANSGYMGSYKVQREITGTYSHVLDYVQQRNNLTEYQDDGTGMPTGNILLIMDLPGDLYRISKARPIDLDIVAMRKTSGMPLSTLLDVEQLWNIAGATTVTVNNLTSITKTSTNNAYDSQIYSKISYIKPTFSVQLSTITGSQLVGTFGFSEIPSASTSNSNVNYGWAFDLTIPAAQIYELGNLVLSPVSPIVKAKSIYEINFDGTNVNYLVDGLNVRSTPRSSTNYLYLNLLPYQASLNLSNIYFNGLY